ARMVRACVGLLVFSLAASARADERREGGWYGHQTLIVDVSSIASVGVGAALATRQSVAGGALIATGILGYAIGPGIVHGAGHRHGGSAARSVAWRLLAPAGGALLGLILGASLENPASECYGCTTALGAALGASLGYGTAVIVDAAALA